MEMHIRNAARLVITMLAVAWGGISTAQTAAPAYSATAVHAFPGQAETFGTIVKSGQNLRLEFDENGRHVIQILLPAVGAMYVLDPEQQTYVEILGPAVPAADVGGYKSPCPGQKPDPACQHVGDDVMSGVKVERWVIASGDKNKPLVLLWNSARRRALKQILPDGSVMTMAFRAMEKIDNRLAEHWTIKLTRPGQPDQTGDWWFDPELRVVIKENLPSGETRRLENITVGPVNPAMFQVPQGWRKVAPAAPKPPTAALQSPVAAD